MSLATTRTTLVAIHADALDAGDTHAADLALCILELSSAVEEIAAAVAPLLAAAEGAARLEDYHERQRPGRVLLEGE